MGVEPTASRVRFRFSAKPALQRSTTSAIKAQVTRQLFALLVTNPNTRVGHRVFLFPHSSRTGYEYAFEIRNIHKNTETLRINQAGNETERGNQHEDSSPLAVARLCDTIRAARPVEASQFHPLASFFLSAPAELHSGGQVFIPLRRVMSGWSRRFISPASRKALLRLN